MLEKIVETSKYVVKYSEAVKIDEDKISEFANELKQGIRPRHYLSTSPYSLLDLPIGTIINLLLIYESIDFSFWGNPKWIIHTPEGDRDGSAALLYALLQYTKRANQVDFSNFSYKEVSNILKSEVPIPLLEERCQILKNISQVVKEKMNGNFYNYTKDITVDTELFDIIIKYFPNFEDKRTYKGKTIYFYKLAQLLVSDILHIRELKEGIKVNYSHLVGCADYKIPQIMRAMGILKYSKGLEEIIDTKKELDQNSIYEVEIRASVIVAIEKIRKRLENKIMAIDINDYIWLKSQKIKSNLKPYHLTRNTNY